MMKNYKIIQWIIVGILLLSFIQTCSIKRNIKQTIKLVEVKIKNDSITHNQILNIIDNLYTKEEFDIKLEIKMLEMERSTLHNMNEIVLKNIRPAKQISVIDLRIKELYKLLGNYNDKK